MSQYADLYFLVESRNLNFLNKFLDEFTLKRTEAKTEYYVPMFSDNPLKIFTNSLELMKFLQENYDTEYAIYWENLAKNTLIRHIMLFYTDDGCTILGVSVPAKSPIEKSVISIFKKIKNFTNSKLSCITMEEPPPTNSDEFKNFCDERIIPI